MVVASVAATSVDIDQSSRPLQVGDYFRPPSDNVTAFADSTSPVTFRRSPCPGLNALANHGHIPRSGKNITHENLGAALMSVFNTDTNFTQTLLNQVPNTFSLDLLSRHNVVEHDASLMHDDAFFGVDPMNVNKTLVNDLFNRSLDGKTLGVTELGETRSDRLAACRANNPQCVFGANQTAIAYLEAAVFIIGFGGNVNESVTLEAARSFVWHERIPENYTKSAVPVSLDFMRTIVAKLMAHA
ncbi:chloroperoxidase [Phytophthora sojae]|uniref:Chloroperoxidase n=1 Tax=Phytophthora sojae (strain P6497) TaxID=1094619 RepID=G5AHA1_PHYSP|nr:chloroperoxidase [Phytophthora sojae]EGZ05080.1 chloroperoxidase [Phytophthora sojae]|eukprot:XP_009539452.1 chloroperoxidase [Phytophthora sojae]